MEGIQIEEYRLGALKDIALLKTQGYVDTNTSPELQKVLSQTIEQGIYRFIIDMAAVQYVSSAGWGVFVGEIRRLQEKGGDLKISQMSPEVYEVFEMLEFNRILDSYDSIEEAIEDFDFCRELNALVAENPNPQIVARTPSPTNWDSAAAAVALAPEVDTVVEEPIPVQRRQKAPFTREIEDKNLPLHEKIKKMVLENPVLGVWGLKRMLYSPRFGYTQIGLWNLYKTLKGLALETKTKRFRYFRSR